MITSAAFLQSFLSSFLRWKSLETKNIFCWQSEPGWTGLKQAGGGDGAGDGAGGGGEGGTWYWLDSV